MDTHPDPEQRQGEGWDKRKPAHEPRHPDRYEPLTSSSRPKRCEVEGSAFSPPRQDPERERPKEANPTTRAKGAIARTASPDQRKRTPRHAPKARPPGRPVPASPCRRERYRSIAAMRASLRRPQTCSSLIDAPGQESPCHPSLTGKASLHPPRVGRRLGRSYGPCPSSDERSLVHLSITGSVQHVIRLSFHCRAEPSRVRHHSMPIQQRPRHPNRPRSQT
jgi:hypothetical protein